MAWDAIIFDCDGVLVDSERISNRVLADALTEIGLPTTLDESVARYMGRGLGAVLEIVESQLGRAPPDDFIEHLRVRTLDALAHEITEIRGVSPALAAIAYPVAVASSGDPDKIAFTLGATGLLDRFDGRVFSGFDVARGKPAPDLYLHAARTLGAAPERCAVVEDSPVGARAGVAAGAIVFGYADLTPAAALEREGAIAFTDMSELPALLDRHAPRPHRSGSDVRRSAAPTRGRRSR